MELKNGVLEVRSYMKGYVQWIGSFEGNDPTGTTGSDNENDEIRVI